MVSDQATRDIIMKWTERAQIDYSDLYTRLYIAYNAWFRRVTHSNFDREAINRLQKRFVIWDEYEKGRTLQNLTSYFQHIVRVTTKNPLVSSSRKWDGVVSDWRDLIYFWYHVRCDLFHGQSELSADMVELAYQSLNCFMLEVTTRMKTTFSDIDHIRLLELDTLLESSGLHNESMRQTRTELHQKFINSSDLWGVDMVRYEKGV